MKRMETRMTLGKPSLFTRVQKQCIRMPYQLRTLRLSSNCNWRRELGTLDLQLQTIRIQLHTVDTCSYSYRLAELEPRSPLATQALN